MNDEPEKDDALPVRDPGGVHAIADSLGYALVDDDAAGEQSQKKSNEPTGYTFADLKEVLDALAEDPAFQENLHALRRGEINREESRVRTREILSRLCATGRTTNSEGGT